MTSAKSGVIGRTSRECDLGVHLLIKDRRWRAGWKVRPCAM